MDVRRVTVYCGASAARDPAVEAEIRKFGREIATRGITLVYGGSSLGLMGSLADEVISAGGKVIGVIPESLVARELAHSGLTELRVVGSMHERKATMASLVDGFVALPGGLGTLDETFEALTWAQLGIHAKPVGVLNVEGYWNGLRRVIDHAVQERFVRPEYAALLLFADTPDDLLDRFAAWQRAAPGAGERRDRR